MKANASIVSSLCPLVDHAVIIVKENHTYGNYFGTFPNSAGDNQHGKAPNSPGDPKPSPSDVDELPPAAVLSLTCPSHPAYHDATP